MKHVLEDKDGEALESTGIICKVWNQCHHPELCQESCYDEDLVESIKEEYRKEGLLS